MTAQQDSSGTKAADFVLLDGGCYFGQSMRDVQDPSEYKTLDVYDLPGYDLSPHLCLVVDPFVDQELLYRQREQIRRYLDQGGLLLFSGQMFLPWIPGASSFVPKTIRHHRDYTISVREPCHPIFEGVLPEDMTYNKGVAGFFARGHHPLPSGAEALLTLPGGEPITYIDRQSTRGTMIVHSGNHLLGYSGSGKTTGRIRGQLVRWIREEAARNGERMAVR